MAKNKIVIFTGLLFFISLIPLYSFGFGRGHHASNYTEPEGMVLSGLDLADGLYYGSANGFRPDLQVAATVENGTVTHVEVTDHNEVGRRFWELPVNVIPGAIVSAGESEVDVVSGATATSKAIMAAVENALGMD